MVCKINYYKLLQNMCITLIVLKARYRHKYKLLTDGTFYYLPSINIITDVNVLISINWFLFSNSL